MYQTTFFGNREEPGTEVSTNEIQCVTCPGIFDADEDAHDFVEIETRFGLMPVCNWNCCGTLNCAGCGERVNFGDVIEPEVLQVETPAGGPLFIHLSCLAYGMTGIE